MAMKVPRKLYLTDIMALVAATAMGLAGARALVPCETVYRTAGVSQRSNDGRTLHSRDAGLYQYTGGTIARYFASGWRNSISRWVSWIGLWPVPGLAAWSLTSLGLGLRQPRPRRPTRRPGAAAGLAVFVAIVAMAFENPTLWLNRQPDGSFGRPFWGDWWIDYCFALPRVAGPAVLASWVVLASSGGWAPGRDWLDRLGRLLGACWIGIAAMDLASPWLLTFLI